MRHFIIGYGYCGFYLAKYLLETKQQVTTFSRTLDSDYHLSEVQHIQADITQKLDLSLECEVLYYLVPPNREGKIDIVLQQFLANNCLDPKTIIYFGSSGVYGQHHGEWVDEKSKCNVVSDRQCRRLDAEAQWIDFANSNSSQVALLRVAGIYGPNRLPLESAKNKIPVIEPAEAPFINHIYVRDLVKIAYELPQFLTHSDVFNVADGEPLPMGGLQQLLAELLGVEAAHYESFTEAYAKASPFKREFLSSSKRLSISKLKQSIGDKLVLTPKKIALLD